MNYEKNKKVLFMKHLVDECRKFLHSIAFLNYLQKWHNCR